MDIVMYNSYKHLRIGYESYPDGGKRAEEFLNHTCYGMFSDAESFHVRFDLEENGAHELDMRDAYGDTIVDDVLSAM